MGKKKQKGAAVVERRAERLETLRVETVEVSAIRPNPYNPNRQSPHEFELLQRSIREDGFTQPVVLLRLTEEHLADARFQGKGYAVGETVIVDGEHRWRAAHALGLDTVPGVYVPMTAAQMRVATLRHNRARGSEDLELTAEVLRDLRELGALDWAQDSLQLSDIEVTRLIEDIDAPESLKAEEFSQAWEPEPVSGKQRMDQTDAAGDRIRQIEQRIDAARTQEEKAMARRESNIFRVVLVFTGEEAEVVKAVLGSRPAEALLRLCQAQAAATVPQEVAPEAA